MHRSDQIRRWRPVGLCGLLLCLAVHGVASAAAQTSTPPKKPAHASAAPASKAKHHTSGNETSKRTSTNTSSHTSAHSSRTSAHTSTRTSSHTSAQKSNSHGKKGSKLAAKKRGQQAIDSDRAREIQEALIRERYIEGEPTGSWDDATQAAMQRYQADQGWQSKTTPDSRALIKLGLGPSHDHLLNPESAMTATTSAADDPKAGTKQTPAADNLPKQ